MIVVAGDIVHLARLDTARQIDIGIDDAFVVDQRRADNTAVRAENAGESAVPARQQVARGRVLSSQGLNDVLGDGRARYDGEDLAFEAVGRRAHLDGFCHVVVGRRHRQSDVIGHVHQFALREQRKARQRVGVLAASKRSQRTDTGLVHLEG